MPPAASTIAALIVAAGRGSRSGLVGPKQYAPLGGMPVLRRTVAALRREARIGTIAVVIQPDDRHLFEAAVAGLGEIPAVNGGLTRQQSVRLGLESLASDPPDFVLVHDGARPFPSVDLLGRVLDGLTPEAGVVPALPVNETVKRLADGMVAETLPRKGLHTVQTPQGFAFQAILAAHRAAAGRNDLTDDAAVAEAAGVPVRAVTGDAENVKLTWPEDFERAERRLREAGETRIGQGFDVHAFGPGDHVMLGGVRIPHGGGLVGHSDADVVLHALTDALLGAIGAGDIGVHFPPSDPQWKGAASSRFVDEAMALLRGRAGAVVNVDVTVVCETPKLDPHRAAIAATIAALLDIGPERVSIKATTSERLGFTGRGEGVAALAVASVRLPAAP